jgi:hypothetical protein
LGIRDAQVAPSGAVFLETPAEARQLAHRLNLRIGPHPRPTVAPGDLAATALIGEIQRRLLLRYCREANPGVLGRILGHLATLPGNPASSAVLPRFTGEFPPVPVHREERTVEDHLAGEHDGHPNRETALAELLLLRLANENPAFGQCRELFDDAPLLDGTPYRDLLTTIETFLRSEPGIGRSGATILDLLRAPALASPHSLAGQLEFLLSSWGDELSPYLVRLLTAQDILREESRPGFVPGGKAALQGPGLGLASASANAQRYTPDREWMPNVVMLAKLAHVWLHQLSVQHGLAITRLDEVPDAELDRIGRGGFTALWLIGVWERSPASEEIKRRRGNPEAAASAYSLYDYEIASDLGGWEALDRLRVRALERGIRLAADMVPNHTGIWSRWVVEHPNWFVQLPSPPFPVYRFGGPDLSRDERIGIFIEEGYWTGTDAAVVFRRLDRHTGSESYLYHGNDGTGLPWNDTAQLNFLLPEVRRAVSDTILHVARHFPVIRFDAAMTLTKRHFQRLWFPPPGHGGAIASRAEQGVPAESFHEAMPEEFWREVVDRVNREAPDTLLLAEAFWLLEGFFVRTLGMHRVYNSAFMNMLCREENAKYRQVLRDVLVFDPEVLKRFVNFMNNPDEETAVAQFGKGDKYFGTTVMLATMPGLPMFGHGQIEGFGERYGMEFRKAYREEPVDDGLVAHHERVIFPLLRRRYLFSGSDRFTMYDLVHPDGGVQEDVFAYSNGMGEERALIVFNNRHAGSRGWIRQSVPCLPPGGASDSALELRTLANELGVPAGEGVHLRFRDAVSGLEYLRSGRELAEQGLFLDLPGFGHHAFLDFLPVTDKDGSWAALAALLHGAGIPSLDTARSRMALATIHEQVGLLLDAAGSDPSRDEYHDHIALAAVGFLDSCLAHGTAPDPATGALRARDGLIALDHPEVAGITEGALPPLPPGSATRGAIALWLCLVWDEGTPLFDRLMLSEPLAQRGGNGLPHVVRILLVHGEAFSRIRTGTDPTASILRSLLDDAEAALLAGVNSHQGIVWFNKEGFAALIAWLRLASAISLIIDPGLSGARRAALLAADASTAQGILSAAECAGYRVDHLLDCFSDSPQEPAGPFGPPGEIDQSPLPPV